MQIDFETRLGHLENSARLCARISREGAASVYPLASRNEQADAGGYHFMEVRVGIQNALQEAGDDAGERERRITVIREKLGPILGDDIMGTVNQWLTRPPAEKEKD